MEPAVVVEDLVKEYRIYSGSFARLKEALSFGRRSFHTTHRALDGVSLEVPRGRALGVIGENGAGKSTLLKVLAGTSMATSGSFRLNGNVASLLELGTGFHSEFTGRDNIYLAAQVQGFSLKEVESKIDEIVAFAELGPFIDQPVRTYSSGMVMRLGFAVATAIDPEVLIIDEILAVGDLYFQKKCVDRIFEFRKRGRSILFCSHSMYDVRQICDEVVWIHGGKVRMRGEPQDVTVAYANYERALHADPDVLMRDKTRDTAEDRPVIASVTLLRDVGGEERPLDAPVRPGQRLVAEMELVVRSSGRVVHVAWGLFRNDNIVVTSFFSALADLPALQEPGRYRCRLVIPEVPLLEGEYNLVGYLLDDTFVHTYDHRQVDRPLLVTYDKNVPGVVQIPHEFVVEKVGEPLRNASR